MSLPNAIASGTQIYEIGNAQFNTMVCKESVNLTRARKKRELLAQFPLLCPVLFGGGRRAKRD
jgi:hypothetical protein